MSTPRRAPTPDERRQDADRSRRLLLSAAFDEFAAKGFAGARVHEIAARAGVNKQLINYYFGGKEGLYRELQQAWLDREATFNTPQQPLADLAVRYLRESLADPRGIRLMVWRGLDSSDTPPDESPIDSDLAYLRDRQHDEELAADLDPAAVLLLMMAAISAPIVMPDVTKRLFGIDPTAPEFEQRYGAQIRLILEKLSG
ncbi:TetR/AcrR family transcriptional regulator [Allokutzneria sp. A3M-2-11 16]|uniref:TetR/AcrR family transcriptional regulator n=1 Tax=Allokutzneria sp. A3M-2-11 16 TaxID=2962043 RepID=UPI0020B8014C|nr:TetR family transcriptional regulator [Allokutzneria sp. A3M-2-11 16]MCP3800293.1 TetR/AcrR family transcriptional regulator [Allokutzneria sp. A3M-2-11 16]